MMKLVYAYVIAFFSMIALDSLWLFSTIDKIYKKYIGHLMASKFMYWPAFIFYTIYALGITVFIIAPYIDKETTLFSCALRAFILGVFAYSTYDLTNQCTLMNWPVFITVIDILWGGIITLLSSMMTIKILKLLKLI